MNQILYVEEEVKKNRKADITKIVKFFAIVIIVFGLVLAGRGSYGIYKYYDDEKKMEQKKAAPVINIARTEDDLIITATHSKVISQMIYSWNGMDENIVVGSGENSMESTIEIPVGTNALKVTVIDALGNRAVYEGEYTSVSTLRIALSAVGAKIKVTASDENGMKNVKIKWNNEAEQVTEATENDKKIEVTTEIPIGENTITVVAENSSGRIQKKAQEVKGIRKPIVNLSKDGQYLVIKVMDATGVSTIDYSINDKPYKLEFISNKGAGFYNSINGLKVIEASGKYTEVVYRQQLNEGENLVKLKAINLEKASAEVVGTCTHTSQ